MSLGHKLCDRCAAQPAWVQIAKRDGYAALCNLCLSPMETWDMERGKEMAAKERLDKAALTDYH